MYAHGCGRARCRSEGASVAASSLLRLACAVSNPSRRRLIGNAMPRFKIDLRTESHIADTIVVEQEDQTALRQEVARFVGETLRDHALQIWVDEDWRVDVSDETGLILFILQISATSAPAATPLAER